MTTTSRKFSHHVRKNLIIISLFLSLSHESLNLSLSQENDAQTKFVSASANVCTKKKRFVVCDVLSVICFPLNNEYTQHTLIKKS